VPVLGNLLAGSWEICLEYRARSYLANVLQTGRCRADR
jgi:hypothetical protein